MQICASRFQIQERFTDEIATAINTALHPRGVAVVVKAEHDCMSSRGVRAHDVQMVTKTMLGAFDKEPELRREFLSSLEL